uniref:Uncharacterized protein n=1 Tax=viral metagenome TaxID=1070528 RepID=A0A6C0IZ36_9ZZZZ
MENEKLKSVQKNPPRKNERMGTKLSKTKLAPPKIIDQIRSEEFAALIRDRLKPNHLRIADHVYDIYSMADLRRFLNLLIPWVQLLPDGNLALQLLGRERIWYGESAAGAGAGPPELGLRGLSSTFGYIVGDIRLPEEPYTKRLCSANFFVDRDRQVWIVDPRTGRVYQPTLQTAIEIALI